MNSTLKKLKDITSECCVTITLATHRTKPDNQKDELNLKNLVKEVEERLYNDYEKRFVWPIMENLNALVEEIDHNYNLDGLVIFVNDQGIAEYTRLPIKVENRTVVDKTFATRDLVRAMHLESSYYVLVLSRDEARMIEAHNDKVVRELSTPFPIENTSLYSTNGPELSNAQRQTNLVQEFFNRVDKVVNEVVNSHPLPVIIATETSNFSEYQQIADNKGIIIGHINKNRNNEKSHHIIPDAWEVVKGLLKDRNEARLAELRTAVGTGKFKSDFNDIWASILAGKGQTLFVEKGYFQPAKLNNGSIELLPAEQAHDTGVVDDIIDEMIEFNLRFGGDTVFLAKEDLADFQGLGLITRY
jgi:hypothetical protein